MTTVVFDLNLAEKLDFTFNFEAELDGIDAEITGSPTITITALNTTLEPTPLLALVSSTVTADDDTNDTKVVCVFNTTATGYAEYNVVCKVTADDAGSRVFEQGMVIIVRPAALGATDGATTTGRVIRELGITDETTQNLIPDLIAEATESIEKELGFPIKKATITETLAGYNVGNILRLRRSPIISVTSVSFDGVALPTTDYSIHDADNGLIYLDGGVQSTERSCGNLSNTPAPGSAEKLYSVVYVAGWILPGVAGRTLPRPIERVAIELVRLQLNMPSNPNVKSESVDGVYSVTYLDRMSAEGAIPSNLAAMLAPYKRLAI